MKTEKMKILVLGVAALMVAVVLLVLTACYTYGTDATATVTIEDTEVKTAPGSRTQTYLVFTDRGVFQNSDTTFRVKWNSSDMHAQFKKLKGQRAVIHYYGWRIPFFSQYPNIYKVEAISQDSK